MLLNYLCAAIGTISRARSSLNMHYDLELTLLGQLCFLGPVTTVYMFQIYVPEHLRSHPSQIDENQHFVCSKQKWLTNN